MITLGVDFAAQPENTAACEVDWQDGSAKITLLELGIHDERLLVLSMDADKVALDVPFGWPAAFIDSISAHRDGVPWPQHSVRELRYRRTDRFVHSVTGKWPLSVSTDRIGITSFRAASLLSQIGHAGDTVDRIGTGKYVEVYPAAAIRVWALGPCTKRDTVALATELWKQSATWLLVSDEARARVQENRHSLDALIAALVARASALRLCEGIPAGCAEAAESEGWIALPFPGSLDMLARNG